MSAVYIQQIVWCVTVTCDMWHVTSTLKRTITKSTLIWVAVLCALRRQLALADPSHELAVDRSAFTSTQVFLLFLSVRCHIHLLTPLTQQNSPCPALSTRWSPCSLAPTGSSGTPLCRPTFGHRASGTFTQLPNQPMVTMTKTTGTTTLREHSVILLCASLPPSRLPLPTLLPSLRMFGTTSRRVLAPPVSVLPMLSLASSFQRPSPLAPILLPRLQRCWATSPTSKMLKSHVHPA